MSLFAARPLRNEPAVTQDPAGYDVSLSVGHGAASKRRWQVPWQAPAAGRTMTRVFNVLIDVARGRYER